MARDPYPAIAEKYDKQVQQAIYSIWDTLRRSRSLVELENIIATQGVFGVMQLLSNMEDEVTAQLMPVLEQAILESGRAVISILPSKAVLGPIAFSMVLPSVSSYVRNYTGIRIREISNETREAVRIAVSESIITGRNPKQTARDFRSSIGLTVNQEKTVQRFKTALEKGDAAYINSLTTPNKSVKEAIESAAELSQSRIDSMVEQQRAKYVKLRSETIARTESLTALSVGQNQAIRTGLLTGAVANELLKRWLYRVDGRARDAHISTGNNNGWIPISQAYVTPLGPLMFPRDPAGTAANVINCRCREQYSLPEDIVSLGSATN